MSAAKIAASLRSTRSSAIEKPRLHSNVGGISGSNNVRFGSKQTCAAKRHDRESGIPHKTMSALPPKADMCGATRDVRYGPKADISNFIRSPRRHGQQATAVRSALELWRPL